jgi:hypothetical protein
MKDLIGGGMMTMGRDFKSGYEMTIPNRVTSNGAACSPLFPFTSSRGSTT